jgi:hypothetical protein
VLSQSRGASLIEALAAMAIVGTVSAGAGQLLIWGRRASWTAGSTSMAVTLANQKMTSLQALRWDADVRGTVTSDETTDLSTTPPATGGPGLRPSPAGTLTGNTMGFVDFTDSHGRWCGNGPDPPERAAFVRRWSIQPFAPDPSDTIVLTVVVLPLVDAAVQASHTGRGARLTTVRTRVIQ